MGAVPMGWLSGRQLAHRHRCLSTTAPASLRIPGSDDDDGAGELLGERVVGVGRGDVVGEGHRVGGTACPGRDQHLCSFCSAPSGAPTGRGLRR